MKELQTLSEIMDSLKSVHNTIVQDIFYSDNDLFASQDIDNQFKIILEQIAIYKSKINDYTAKSYVPNDLFSDERIKQFNINEE